MIALSQLTAEIESGLNGLDLADFKIFTDVGEFQGAYRQEGSNLITHYVNGIMEAMAPTRIPMKNLEVLTQSFRIGFVLDMDLLNKDTDGNYKEVKNIRAILEKYIASVNGKPFYLDELDDDGESTGISFEITPSYSGVIVGTAMQMSPIGNVLPMYLDFSCVFIQGGVNTNTVDFIVNGENMFYQEYSITRTRTAETNMVANEKSSKTLIQANGISLNLKLPLLNTDQSKAIEEDVWSGGQNEAICVERVRHLPNDASLYKAYIMIYGNNAENGNVGQNIGQVVDLAEGKQDCLTYGEKWTITSFTGTEVQVSNLGLPASVLTKDNIIIFWGDGKVVKTNKTSVSSVGHIYSESGTYTIRIYSY